MSAPETDRAADPLTMAERYLSLSDRAESPSERATLLALTDATLAPLRDRLGALTAALRVRQAHGEPLDGES